MAARLTEATIRALSTPQSFARGQQYYQSGAVFNTSRQGDLLTGECEGSLATAYQLRVELEAGGVRTASCTCPYGFSGFCKHIIALLLTYLYQPEEFLERRQVSEVLAELNRADLLELISQMTERDPNLYDWLETAIPAARAPSQSDAQPIKDQRRIQASAKVYRRQIRGILHSLDGYRMSEIYWMLGGMVQELGRFVDVAEACLAAGEAEEALTILMTLLEEVAGRYDQFDDSDGVLGDFLAGLGLPLAEAILSIQQDKAGRRTLKGKLEPIVSELADYGIDGLEVALEALEQGWATIDAGKAPEVMGEAGWEEAADLTQAQLNVLERQGRTDEYLKLCQQAGEYRRYVLMLLEVGRAEEAMPVALNRLASAEEALSVAEKLRELGQVREAITLGERGLALPGHKQSLGVWLGRLEEAQGRSEPALLAYRAAFTSLPSLELYRTLKRLAGQGWAELRPEIMDILWAASHFSVLAEVYLLEEDWDHAIQVADQAGFWSYALVERVADGVLSQRPAWVIQVSIQQADGLIEKTQSKYYPAAARWLLRAKMAYLAAGRGDEWQAYLAYLKQAYARRPALQRELRQL
jgi:uncharacterized Zn finger protein